LSTKRPPRFYFSFRSPYSWVAARLLNDRYGVGPDEVEYIPTWEPDGETRALLEARGGRVLYSTMSREKHFYILQDIKRLTARLGYRMKWPIDREPWWELPNLAYLAARREGKGREFFDAAYRARWEEGEDICSVETVKRLAAGAGLDPEAAASAPGDGELRAQGAEALFRCYRDGVFGVPFFIKGYEKFWGVDRLELFVAALRGQSGATA
jgi:2-hydroxychromene-2-carboxylate isomerase